MKQILLQDISETLTAASPEYRAVLPEVTDISGQEGIRLEVDLLEEGLSELEVTLYPLRIARPEFFPSVSGRVAVMGTGSRFVDIPFGQFGFRQMVRAFLNYLDGISVRLVQGGAVALKGIAADTMGNFSVQAEGASRVGETGEWVDYPVMLVNQSDRQRVVNICQSLYGKECLPTKYVPYIVLKPHENKLYDIRIQITEDIPAGGSEKSTFLFVPEGDGAQARRIVFRTAKRRKHPYLFLKEEQWQKRRAALAADEGLCDVFHRTYVETAENWEVPKASADIDHVYPAYAQNVLFQTAAGFGILRDGKAQAVLKFGGHGGYHGHYDRLSLASYMNLRDDTTFHNNEYAWFGYGSFLFKMWVQTSMAHNMTVVDGRMQKPSQCECVYYEENQTFRAVCAQTVTEWIEPPYGGQTPYPYVFPEEKCAVEGRMILQPDKPRKQGDIGEYSEPVFQRRLLVLFHGYCIVWDYLEGQQEHRYDCLYHPSGKIDRKNWEECGFQNAEEYACFSEDAFGSGQFIQNCYTVPVEGTVCLRFHEGQLRVNDNDIMDHMPESSVWRAWPQSGDVTVGRYPHREDTFTEESRRAASGYLDKPLKKTVSFTVRGRQACFATLIEGGRTAERVQAVCCGDFQFLTVTEHDGKAWSFSVTGMTDRGAAVSVTVIAGKV
ncbi:MAG: hypothetical protein K1W30_02890 [Lachnospiraceae bacterium]